MNKADIIDRMAEAADISKAAAGRALEALHNSITEALKAGDSVAFVGFGTYSVGHRQARTGRNPQTGETMQIPAATTVKFKAGKQLKDAVNDK